MRWKNRAGNVLIVAIFMAIFLFFLSVALISQNRMDISLGLSVDHRLKAQEAARSGLDYALSVMRTRSNWADLLKEERTLESGATYRVEVTPFQSENGRNYVLKLVSTGVSGIVKEQRFALVEEFAMPHSAQDSGAPYLFSKTTDNRLAVAGADFLWHELGALPNPASVLAASDGPLFVFDKPGSGTPPPTFLDQIPLFLQDPASGGITTQPGPLVRMELVPPGEHILYLKLTNGQAEWIDIPDPGTQLGKHGLKLLAVGDSEELKALPAIKIWQDPANEPDDRPPWHRRNVRMRGQSRKDSGFDIFQVEMENGSWSNNYNGALGPTEWVSSIPYEKNAASEENTLEWEELTGGQIWLEWYSLDGTDLFARGNQVFCHGTHYFYGHINSKDVEYPEYGTATWEALVFRRPCVLKYDLDTKKWETVADFMKVDDPSVEPHLDTCPDVYKDTLVVDKDNNTYAFSDEKNKRLLKLADRTFRLLGPLSTSIYHLVLYNDQPHFFDHRNIWSTTSTGRTTLTSVNTQPLDPNKEFFQQQQAVTARVPQDEELTEVQVRPAQVWETGLQAAGQDVAVSQNALVCSGYLRRDIEDNKPTDKTEGPQPQPVGYLNNEKSREVLTLFYFDGVHWQMWPGGPADLMHVPRREQERETFLARNQEGKTVEIAPRFLALGRYDEGYSPVNRYKVLLSGSGTFEP